MYDIRVIRTLIGGMRTEQPLDLNEGTFPYNFEANDIAVLKSSASWSYSIKLPRTPNNEHIFKYAGSPFVNSDGAYRRYLCNVYADGIKIVSEGVLFIDAATKTDYSVQILSGVSDVFEMMKDALLNDEARWAGYADRLAYNTIPADTSLLAYSGSAVVSDDGQIKNNTKDGDIYWYATPMVRVRGLLNAILTDVLGGYSLNTDAATDTLINKLCLSLCKRVRYGSSDLGTNEQSLANTTLVQPEKTTACQITLSRFIHNSFVLQYMPAERNNGNISAMSAARLFFGVDGNSAGYLLVDVTKYESGVVLGKYLIQKQGGAFHIDGYTNIEWDGTLPIKVAYGLDNDNSDNKTNIKVSFSDTQWIDPISQQTFVGLPTEQPETSYTHYGYIKLKETTYPLNPKERYAYNGQSIIPMACIGYSNALDVFKTLSQVFGWIVRVDEQTKTIHAHGLQYVSGRKAYAHDWSDKVVSNEDEERKFALGNYGQTNYITYEENKVSGFTDGAQFAIANSNLQPEYEAVKVGVTSGRGNTIEHYLFKEQGVYEWKDGSKPHLLKYDGALTHYMAADTLTQYQGLRDTLENVEVLTCKMVLNVVDVATFDPYTPIYLQQTGRYYYVNKIAQWEIGKVCEVELVRLK